ncbi:hypothetical protein M885DRAFT_523946 [Pelagophyceae sp. CCMP2097]|nr:hypothetical protein M885DRAFT_523946 [Pelagophyceae sp. CCMP2097]
MRNLAACVVCALAHVSSGQAAEPPQAAGARLEARDEWSWAQRLARKRECVEHGEGGVYLYHTRKAAGTTLRDLIKRALATHAKSRYRVPLWETEGTAIDARALALRSVVTVVSLRRPVDRILSMYWYEHVGWWDGVRHEPSQLRPLRDWVNEWRDGSVWKADFARKNPGSVYVEIENYYVKMLTGWNRNGQGEKVDRAALERAKDALRRFDVVFVSERSGHANHTELLSRALGADVGGPMAHTLRADDGAKKRLAQTLAPDVAAVRETLEAFNSLDNELYAFANKLIDARIRHHESEPLRRDKAGARERCEAIPTAQLQKRNGIFRPPGHKH